jgi:CRP-like cAMP-binding protein
MAQLGELKGHAVRLYLTGETVPALRLFDAVVSGEPTDFDARIGVADCLTALGHGPQAAAIYRSVGWYALKSGHPLAAVVVARILEAAGHESDDLMAALVVRYGNESEYLGKMAARIPLPDPTTEVAPPDLHQAPPEDVLAVAARRAETCLDSFVDFPDSVHRIPLLSDLSEDAFRRVLKTLLVRRLPDGAPVIREGEPGESFFFVATGTVRVYATDGLGRQSELAVLSENAIFGEMALISAQPRTASVAVAGSADLLEVTRESLAALADELKPVADALHRFTRDRLLKNLMATSPLFRPFNRPQRLDLLRRFTSHDVAPGTLVINEGDEGRGLFVVLSGSVDVAKTAADGSQTPLATLRTGEIFGEVALLRGGPTTATITANCPTTVLFLSREYVDRLVAGVSEIRRYLDGLAEEREIDTQLLMNDDDFVEDDERVLI